MNPGDMVYHLGDFGLTRNRKDGEVVERLLEKLNGNKVLICGNHDRDAVKNAAGWSKVADYAEAKVDMGGVHKQRIVMSHYPLRSWNQMHRGAWMLHGHCHGNIEDIGGKTIDVGVDCHDYRPVSIDEVAAEMSHRETDSVDHHTAQQTNG